MKKGTKALIGVIIGVIVCITISVGVLLYFSSKPADYTIQNGVFKISGMYGQEILINQLTSVEIKENIPEVITRTNGSGLGTMLKGYFKLKDIGEAKLFVDASKTPFIYLKTKSNLIILNCEESKKTKELYQEILNKWSK